MSAVEEKRPKAAVSLPDLKKFVDKRVAVRLSANRRVSGFLKGFDHFMNLLLSEAVEEHADGSVTPMGPGTAPCVIRGHMVINLEPVVQ